MANNTEDKAKSKKHKIKVKEDNTNSKIGHVLKKIKNVNALNKFNSFIFSLFFIAFLSFLVILLIYKFGSTNSDLTNGSKIIKGTDGISIIESIPIYIGILSFFFTVFIFIFQSYIKTLLDTISNIPDIIKMNTAYEMTKKFEEKNKEYDKKQKALMKSMTGLIKKPQELSSLIEKNRKYYESNSRLVFLIANQFLEKSKQVPVESIASLLDLWNEDRAQLGAYALRGKDLKLALPFLKERLEHYKKHKKTQIASVIKEAIEDLEKKTKKS